MSCAHVKHEFGGDIDINMKQDVCTEQNGFDTAEKRRECILCMRDEDSCPDPETADKVQKLISDWRYD